MGIPVDGGLPQAAASRPATPQQSAFWARALLAAGLGTALVAVVYALLYPGLWYGEHDVSDIVIYLGHAQSMASGHIPYRDFAFEYPPIAAWLFAVPGHTGSYESYLAWFSFTMFLFTVATAAAVAAAAARLWPEGIKPYLAAVLFAAGLAAVGTIVENRFDITVALVLALLIFFLARRQLVLAAAVLGAGFALKLTPAALLPLVLLLAPSWRRALRAAAVFLAVAAAPFIPYLAMSPSGVWHIFAYHLQRPLQLESVLATPFLIGQTMGLVWVDVTTSFGSQGIAATGSTAAAALSTWLTAAAVLTAYGLIVSRRRLLLERPQALPMAVLAVVLAMMTFAKVLSPQFFIWLLPLAALVTLEEPLAGGLTFAALLLTQIGFPAKYWGLVYLEADSIKWLALRNLALLAGFAVSLWRLIRLPSRYEEEARLLSARGVSRS